MVLKQDVLRYTFRVERCAYESDPISAYLFKLIVEICDS